ncbi:MAG: hypothetical protein JSW11_01665 [Candidatus Heimdallarchaeota archaeon]|nr:MAG: hypothetical protein JSW11_01665 [Candidatus Heimdallarchaeota archaeon]
MLVQTAIAHVPVAGEPGETLETALEIRNPLKSWVLYDEIHEAGEPYYYTFQMKTGNRLRLILNLPAELQASTFRPSLVIIGPGIMNSTPAPNYLEIPTGSGYIIYDEHTLHPVYEGFTPSAFFEVLNIDTTVPETGIYYLAIYDMTEAERYALAIGFQEVFTVDEWILVAINVIAIHLWEGQNIFVILSPWILTLVLGIIFYSRRGKELGIENDALTWMGIIAGLLFIGSGLALVFQMVWALLQIPANAQVIITILFALFPALIGIATLKVLRGGWKNTTDSTLKLALLSGLAVFTWAGLLIGPLLLLLVSIIGFVRHRHRNSSQEIMS